MDDKPQTHPQRCRRPQGRRRVRPRVRRGGREVPAEEPSGKSTPVGEVPGHGGQQHPVPGNPRERLVRREAENRLPSPVCNTKGQDLHL